VPPTAVVATDVYDEFLDRGNLRERVLGGGLADAEIVRLFQEHPLPDEVVADLRAFLRAVDYPIAVRSSSLLEDSRYQPFAGVYATYMLPNSHPDLAVRLDQLARAIKLVYASVFQAGARSYLEASGNRVEEEKMAVVLQETVGRRHEQYFYPDFAGVAHSTDFYPAPGLPPSDGVVCAALGLGRLVAEGGNVLRFNPRRPGKLQQFGSIADWLKGSQREFLAVDVAKRRRLPAGRRGLQRGLARPRRGRAPRHPGGRRQHLLGRERRHLRRHRAPGPRLVSFAHVLKSGLYPLAEILAFLLELGRNCLSGPVEIEWAATLADRPGRPHRFGFLQIRPLTLSATASRCRPRTWRTPPPW
jgi:hypothetical protein